MVGWKGHQYAVLQKNKCYGHIRVTFDAQYVLIFRCYLLLWFVYIGNTESLWRMEGGL